VIRFYTDHLHPLYSLDYTVPKGGAHDNNGSDHFVSFYEGKAINYLDLGCAGAAIVESMFNKGHNSFGVDGSDAQKKQGMNSWGRIPERLFNADITEPFHFVDEETKETFKFDMFDKNGIALVSDQFDEIARHTSFHLKLKIK